MEGRVHRTFFIISARITGAAMLAVFMLLGLPLLVSAAGETVVINELMWDGTEYIELYNSTANDINLADWQLTRQQPDGDTKEIVKFTTGDTITASTYLLLEKNEAATTIPADKIVSGLSLVNTGELITLLNNNQEIIDQANWLGSWWAGENTDAGVAMERTDAQVAGTVSSNWHSSTGQVGERAGTPRATNSAPKINTPPQAVINSPNEATVNQEIEFTGEDSSDADGDELVYVWSFGDGTTAESSDPTHTFEAAGVYEVTLTVSDESAESQATRAIKITSPVYSKDIVINEFLPNPVGTDTASEFIELKNTGSDSVDLSNWRLDDVEGGSAPYTLPVATVLGPGSIKAFFRSDTKIALNNNGDTVRLLDPAGEVKSSHAYSSSDEGQSVNRLDDGSYTISATITSGASNVITEPTTNEEDEEEETPKKTNTTAVAASKKSGQVAGATAKKVDLQNIRREEEGTVITTEGAVSVPPGIFGETQIYLAGSGIQVYLSSGDFPAVKLGDQVKLTGTLASIQGETRLKLAAGKDLSVVAPGDPPVPHVIKTGNIEEDVEGFLVTIQGQVTQTNGDTFYLDDGSGDAKVYLKETANINKPAMKKGLAITITGVVSETSSGYRVLPRFQEDIRLGLVAGLTSFPATGQPALSSIWIILISIILGYLLLSALLKNEPLLVR